LTLTNEEQKAIKFLLASESLILAARATPWPEVQRVLIADHAAELLDYCRAVAEATGSGAEAVAFCEDKLRLPPEELDPPPLITGNDLRRLGIPRGPAYKQILRAVRDAQLEQRIITEQQALEMARRLSRRDPS
jgi:hypothetical protein